MNNSQGDKATGVAEASPVVLSLKTVHSMLPLVERILTDLQARQETIRRLAPEQLRLERQAEIVVDALHQLQQALDFLRNLVLHDEAVRIVLGKLTHTGETGQHT